ncbi:hypothetical protein AURDEDRAFT_162168 [Auricularia subglabra TFB-10046 SS5]|nr:hypothetical protein AURDEDRAFT_162168 [Auricularia subglabra TFB-10046 SS5]
MATSDPLYPSLSSNGAPIAETPVTSDAFALMQESLPPEDWATLDLVCRKELWQSACGHITTRQNPPSLVSLSDHLGFVSGNSGWTAALWLNLGNLDETDIAQILLLVAANMRIVEELAIISTRNLPHSLIDSILEAPSGGLVSFILHAPVSGTPSCRAVLRTPSLVRLWLASHLAARWWRHDERTGIRRVKTYASFCYHGEPPHAPAFDDITYLFSELRTAVIDCRFTKVRVPVIRDRRLKFDYLALRNGRDGPSVLHASNAILFVQLGSPHIISLRDATQSILFSQWDRLRETPSEVAVFGAAPAGLRQLEVSWPTVGRTLRCPQIDIYVLNDILGSELIRLAGRLTLWSCLRCLDLGQLASPDATLDAQTLVLLVLDAELESALVGEDYRNILRDQTGPSLRCPNLRELHIVSRTPLPTLPFASERPTVSAGDVYRFVTSGVREFTLPLQTLDLRGVHVQDEGYLHLLSELVTNVLLD